MSRHGSAIVGCGMIAEIPGAKVLQVFDTSAERAPKNATLADEGCKAYSNLEPTLADPALDVVSVCATSESNMRQAERAR